MLLPLVAFKLASTLEPTLQALADADADQAGAHDDRGTVQSVVRAQEEQAFRICELVLAGNAAQLLQKQGE